MVDLVVPCVLSGHEDDSIIEIVTFDSVLCHLSLNLVEQTQCCVSWEIRHSNSNGSASIPFNS